jgi:putative membrane protein
MIRLTAWLPAVLGFVIPTLALAQSSGGYYGHPMWGSGWHPWFFGPIMMIVFVGVVVFVIVLLVRWLGPSGHSASPHQPSANRSLDILKERFARGEIDKEEFEERRRVLGD